MSVYSNTSDFTSSVPNSFSKYVETYDRYAFIQKRGAQWLRNRVERLGLSEDLSVLEIGCGTGIVTRHMIDLFPKASMLITDLSPKMVEKSEASFGEQSSVHYEIMDGRKVNHYEAFDLIVSGFTLQWFDQEIDIYDRIWRALKPNGHAWFSFLAKGSFPEWKYYAEETNVPFTANELPDEVELASMLNQRGIKAEVHVKLMSQVYPTSFNFLNSMKQIGAGVSLKNKMLSPAQVRLLTGFWDAENEYGVEVRHRVALLHLHKD